jgi:hypothetical protein
VLLFFDIIIEEGVRTMRTSTIVATAIVLVMLGASFTVMTNNASAAQGTRDTYGYRWTDSKSPAPTVSFNWIEISSTGTNSGVTGDDNYGGAFPIGFNFTFYGNVYSTFYLSTNGYITFGSGSWDYTNDNIPSTNSPNNYIAAYWDDLTTGSGTIYYQTTGVEPFRSLVVEYYHVRPLSYSNLMTFEIMINETGDMWLQYLTMNGMTGTSATVGVENSGGTVGTRYSYNTASLTDSLAIKISVGQVMLSQSQTKAAKPGTAVSYNLTVTNRQNTSDSFAITAYSANGWTLGLYDSLMNPLVDHDGDTIPDTGVIGSFSSVNITVTVTIPLTPLVSQDITTVNATSYTSSSVNDTCTLTTRVLAAWFSPPHTDEGWDRDNNGEYDYLYVNASLYVYTAGWYTVLGYVYTPTDIQIAYQSNYSYLSTGVRTVSLKYYGWDIRMDGYDGPYHVELWLRDNSWTLLDQDIHYTSAYLATDFMRIPATFTLPFSDCGVDTDSDGLYDFLQINLTAAINYDGRYRIRTYLYDSGWNWIATVTNDTMLSAGSANLQMQFDAWDISENGLGGQFRTWNYLYVWIDGSWYNTDSDSYTTASYQLSMFERPAVLFAPPHSDHVNDTDGDSLFDFLTVDVSVNVSVEGDYSIIGVMTDWWGTTIDTVTNTTHLGVGDWVVELVYPGFPIRYNGEDGPFDVALTAMSGSYVLDTDSYSTASYWYTSFEDFPAWFELPHDATGMDSNSDGLYESLVVNVTVNVTLAASYEIHANLRDSWWNIVEQQTSTTYLLLGPNTVQLRFTGWMIRTNGLDGPYTILLELRDSGARLLDTDSFATPAFLYTQFEDVPASLSPPHTYQAVDDDGDSLYEMLLVNVSVDVASSGTFFVEGVLYDSGWSAVMTNGTWATLAAGTQIVQLWFPGFMIEAHGVNGVFNIYIELQDSHRNYLDDDYITTTSFNHASFDAEPPSIDSAWADIGPTIDGTLGASEWASATLIDLQTVNPTNGLAGTMLVMNDGVNLYIAYDAFGDMTEDTGDVCAIGFDTGNDDTLTNAREDQFVLRGVSWNSQSHYVYNDTWMSWTTDCSPFDVLLPNHAGLAGAIGFGPTAGHLLDHRTYELSIPLALLGVSPGQSIGFIGSSYSDAGIYDSHASTESSWPMAFMAQPLVTQYGDLHLAASSSTPAPTTTALVTGTEGSANWYVSAVSVSLSATGGRGGVDHTEYRMNNGTWTTYTAPIVIASDGEYTLDFRSVDNNAQTEATQTINIRIDTVAPTATAVVSGDEVSLSGTDAGSGIASMMYRVDNGTWMTYTGVITITGAGTHVVEFYAIDVAGNEQSIQSVSVVIKNTSSLLSSPPIWVGLIAAIVAALLIIFLLVFRRRKRQAPVPMVPIQAGAPPPGQIQPPLPPTNPQQ